MSEFLKKSLNATLMGGERITRAELDNIPAPKKIGPRHRPIPHAVLLNTLEAVCEDVHLAVGKAHLAVTGNGDNIFGILERQPRQDSPSSRCGAKCFCLREFDNVRRRTRFESETHNRAPTPKGAGNGRSSLHNPTI